MSKLLSLFLTFIKIGAFLFGGGYSMLPLLIRELVENRGWTTEEELLDYFALSQCVPGVISVNTATFVGYKLSGLPGAITATLGVIFVPVLVILAIAIALKNLWQNPVVVHAFAGIRVAVAALIIAAVIRLLRTAVRDWFGIALCVVAFALVGLLGQSPVYVVLGGAALGLVYGRLRR